MNNLHVSQETSVTSLGFQPTQTKTPPTPPGLLSIILNWLKRLVGRGIDQKKEPLASQHSIGNPPNSSESIDFVREMTLPTTNGIPHPRSSHMPPTSPPPSTDQSFTPFLMHDLSAQRLQHELQGSRVEGEKKAAPAPPPSRDMSLELSEKIKKADAQLEEAKTEQKNAASLLEVAEISIGSEHLATLRLEEASSALEQAQQKAEEASRGLEEASQKHAPDSKEVQDARQSQIDAQDQLQKAQTNVEEAKRKLEEAQQKNEPASMGLEEARAKYEEAKKQLGRAEAKTKKAEAAYTFLRVFKEIITTEETYNAQLQEMLTRLHSVQLLEYRSLSPVQKQLIDHLLQETRELKESSDRILENLPLLDANPQKVGQFFQSKTLSQYLQRFATFSNTFDKYSKLLQALPKNSSSVRLLNPRSNASGRTDPFFSLFITPIQRGPRYELLLKEMKKQSQRAGMEKADYEAVQESVMWLGQEIKKINASTPEQ